MSNDIRATLNKATDVDFPRPMGAPAPYVTTDAGRELLASVFSGERPTGRTNPPFSDTWEARARQLEEDLLKANATIARLQDELHVEKRMVRLHRQWLCESVKPQESGR